MDNKSIKIINGKTMLACQNIIRQGGGDCNKINAIITRSSAC